MYIYIYNYKYISIIPFSQRFNGEKSHFSVNFQSYEIPSPPYRPSSVPQLLDSSPLGPAQGQRFGRQGRLRKGHLFLEVSEVMEGPPNHPVNLCMTMTSHLDTYIGVKMWSIWSWGSPVWTVKSGNFMELHHEKKAISPEYTMQKWCFNQQVVMFSYVLVTKNHWGTLQHRNHGFLLYQAWAFIPSRIGNSKLTPLKNMSSSIGMMVLPNIWENKKWQPNHQPAV